MKILAIRGKNLASLAGEFAVDFQSEPLASAGLYAITGPTGSGKSTLLDALCLALYERTPRLQKATAKGESIPDVGDSAVSPADPRTILRRGASEGFAEVDFVGNDAVAYRARWSVRRAHVRANGKLQASDMALLRISDGQQLGDHKKTETLRLIEACIGLSFEQFTRAVLLAQNDFATFLKAPDDERAELLQTLTGTETFSQISRQAYARMKLENEALERLQAQLQGQQALAPDARAEMESAMQAQAAQVQDLQARKAQLESQQRWHQQQAKHAQDLAESAVRHGEALAAQQEAAPRHAQLAWVEQVQDARPLWAEQQRLAKAIAQAAHTHAHAAEQAEQAGQHAQSSQGVFQAAQAQLKLAEEAKAQAQSAMEQARALDASILAVTPEHQAAEQAHAQALAHSAAQLQQQAHTVQQQAAAQQDLDQVQAWLAAHAHLRALSEGWPRWDTLFASAQALLRSQAATEQEASALAQEARDTALHLGTAQSRLALATDEASAAAAELHLQVQACAALDTEALAQRKAALEQERDQVQGAAMLWQQRSELRTQRLRLQAQQQAHGATREEAERSLQESAQQMGPSHAALQSAEQALQLATLAASQGAERLRAQLLPGEACPVCGAHEHPYAEHAPAVDAVLQSLQNHVQAARQATLALQERHAVATASKASAAQAQEQGSRELAQLSARRDALLQDWAGLALQAEVDAVAEEARAPWLLQRQEELRAALRQLGAQEVVYRQNLKDRDAAQQRATVANGQREKAREALAHWSSKASQISQAQESTQRQRAEQTQQLAATLAQLDGAFADLQWREIWQSAPEDYVAQCSREAEDWAQHQQRHTALTQRLLALQLQQDALHTACSQAAQQLAAQAERLAAAQTSLQGFRGARAGLLEGRAVQEVQARLEAAIAQARLDQQAAQAGWQGAQEQATRLQEAVKLSLEQLAQLRTEQVQAQVALAQWLTDFQSQAPRAPATPGLGLQDLEALLAVEPAWIASERQALQSLQQTVASAQAVWQAHQQALAEHAAARATADSAEALQEQVLQLEAELLAVTERLSALKLDLARDDERLGASAALRAQIEQQAAVAKVWSQLGELIGSADGKKFRNFAQQLTLDILLGYGNSHLQGLSRRYRIRRIADSLGLLVVDQDMGDEVRSVHSLSGGESFLVSLALALGLASLSSHRVRVESLFIDEGFGSLDADSLRVAMDALDSLQSLGRKVGVISHVQEMTERIGTRVQVQRQAGGLSRVLVEAGGLD